MCSVTIDIRERELMSILTDMGISHECKPLPVGDILVTAPHMELLMERKTLADLDASIVDGRYSDQKRRMSLWCQQVSENNQPRRTAYIIETEINMPLAASAASVGAYVNSSIRDGISVFRTLSIQETAGLVREIASRMATYKKFNVASQGQVQPSTTTNMMKPLPKSLLPRENLGGPEECFLRQLCQIPSISEKKALSIVKGTKARSMAELIRMIDSQGIDALMAPIPGIGPKLVQVLRANLVGI